ncbi:MAG: hypothetical protein JJ877_09150 [Thalassococcus sp.]|uniref:invasion associated locus B family protein n=1 Tax=Thalassococcus sp. TaxID=1928858 RepID=UPI001B001CB9|nr:invasion associated locus B family protein [Thalassococcus sp.]MBO6867198.1 hypothetical protein [Thalassococcus sp.]
MNSWTTRVISSAVLLAAANMAAAQQESTNRVNAITAWSVFEEKDPRECWAVSTYKESVNTKNGNVVAVTRGDIQLMVFYRPDAGVNGQVAFTGGYPFAEGSTVNVNVDGTEFELFTEGQWAWPATPQDDVKLVTAMKRGADAVLTARSSRGTQTKDTFSLIGFTAAVEDAAKRCQ